MSTRNKSITARKSLIFFGGVALVFFVLTLLSNKFLAAFDITGVRPSAAMNPVLGLVYGWPAILGCAVGNFLCDLASGYGIQVALLGFVPQVLYGAVPFYVWRALIPELSERTRLDSPRKTVFFAILMAASSALMGLAVGAIQFFVSGTDFLSAAWFAFLNDFDMCMIFGLPLMACIDYRYSRYRHQGRRVLSSNERIILLCAGLQLLAFVLIALTSPGSAASGRTAYWQLVFSRTAVAVNVLLVLSIIAMILFRIYQIRHASLRITEKKTGTVYSDEKNRLEYLSCPGTDPKYLFRSDALGSSYEEIAARKVHPAFEETWTATLSTQKGCPMRCSFCDCHNLAFSGNASREDLKEQLRSILNTSGSTHTRRFVAEFTRMGEPAFNRELCDFIEYDLRKEVRSQVTAEEIIPVVCTMMPRTAPHLKEFLQEYCRIKNEIYDGKASLQFSIHTTDATLRRQMFANLSLPLEEIAAIVNALPAPIGEKYALTFAVTERSVIDPAVIHRLFDREKFSILLTPMHRTFNAADNGLLTDEKYDAAETYRKFEEAFAALGWEVAVRMDSGDMDRDAMSSGNLLLNHLRSRVHFRDTEKKKIGLIVAIEMDAIFQYYDKWKELEAPAGFRLIYVEKEHYVIYILQAGMGEIAASAGVQYLITHCGVSRIFNFGVVGGMTPEMKQMKVCLVDRVVHYKYDCSEFMALSVGQVDGHSSIYLRPNGTLLKNALTTEPSLRCVTCCSGDKFVGTAEEKTYLHETFEGDICDMESAGIVLTCEMNDIPCVLFKAVSDGLADGADGFYAELLHASMKCLQVADQVIEKLAMME